jgi:TolB-like protein/DNA-binding SARP family transcriptional activator
MSSARWLLRLFGDFELSEHGSGRKVALPGKRERVLLAYLALSPNGRQPRRKLVTLLWGEAADETTLDNLRTAIFNLRKALGDADRSVVASEDRDIVLEVSAFELDVLAVRRLAAGSEVAELEEATTLYAGDFLDGLSIESEAFEVWRREESTRCKGQILDALTKLMTQLAASGESERAIEAGLRILRLEPLHEAAARSLMRLYAGGGRRATAVELYRTLSDSLKKELGAQPEAETRAVYAEIARGNEGQSAAGDVKSPPSTTVARSAPSATEYGVPLGVSAPAALQKVNRRKIGWLAGGLAGAAALAIALFALGHSLAPAPTGRPPTVVAATPTNAIALAVLPFANLSSEQDQEFFSDGLTEEITSALARIPDLIVVARGSASQFKGERRDLRAIGQSLGATHVIEGSVRKAGARVRITARLVKADNGVNAWTNSYDRELTDVFAIQEEIATSIASALSMPLGLKPGEQLVANRAIDPDSYLQFLRGKAALLQAQANFAQQLALLEPVVAKNPDYAPASAALSRAYGFAAAQSVIGLASPEERARTRAGYQAKMIAAARRAVELDPDLVDAQVQYARTISGPRKLALIEDAMTHALAVDPNHPDALEQYSNLLMAVGRLKEAVALKQRLHDLDPFIPVRNNNFAVALWLDGHTDAAIALLKDSIGRVGRPGIGAEGDLAHIYASMGRYEDAAATLSLILESDRPKQIKDIVAPAVALLRSAPREPADPAKLPRLSVFRFIYLYVGAPERTLEAYEEGGASTASLGYLTHPSYSPVRKTERYKKIMRDEGFVAYWRERGWPSFCRPTSGDDFACE